jgi:hypothetical protein
MLLSAMNEIDRGKMYLGTDCFLESMIFHILNIKLWTSCILAVKLCTKCSVVLP